MLAGSRLLTVLWCVALAGSAALAAVQWMPVEPWVLGPVEVLLWIVICAGLFGLFTLAGVACVAGAVLLLRAVLKRTEPAGALRDCAWLAAAPLLFAGVLALMRVAPPSLFALRDAEFAALAERSTELTDAIERYAAREGHAPLSLDALVPSDLPEPPSTGLASFPEFEYHLFDAAFPGARLAWYDLGENAEYEDLRADMQFGWVGPLEHAVLVVVLDSDGRALGADTDRMPTDAARAAFRAETWSRGVARKAMARDAAERVRGLDEPGMLALLGPPDGEDRLNEHPYGAPYELRLACPSALINWDVFV